MATLKRNLGEHEDYNPVSLMRFHTREEMLSEYNRMKDMFRKRAGAIKRSGEFEGAQIVRIYDEFKGRAPEDDRQLAMKLGRLEGLLSQSTSTLTGMREQRDEAIETFQSRGLQSLNKENWRDFTNFMKSTEAIAFSVLRYRYNTSTQQYEGPDTGKRLEMFELAQQKGITTKALETDFTFFVRHMDEIERLPDRPAGRKMGARTLRRLIRDLDD